MREGERSARTAAVLETAGLRALQGAMVLLPLAFVPSFADRFILPKLLLLRASVILVWLSIAARWALCGCVAWRRSRLDLPILALTLSAAASTATAVNVNVALFGTYTRYGGLTTLVLYAALFWGVTQTVRGEAQARALVRALVAGAYIGAAIAVLQSVSGTLVGGIARDSETAFTYAGFARADGTWGNPNILAIGLAMTLPVVVGEVLCATRRSARIVAVNCAVMMALALGLTFSRSGWIAAAAGVGLAVALVRMNRRTALLTLAAGAAGMLVLVLAAATVGHGVPLLSSLQTRLASLADPVAGTGATRLDIWRAALRLVVQRPLLGSGPDTAGLVLPGAASRDIAPGYVVDETHSQVLQLAVTQGLLGVAAFVWMLVAAIRLFLRRGRDGVGTAVGCGLLAYVLAVQVNFDWVPMTAPFWVLLGAAVVIWGGVEPARQTVPWPRPGLRRLPVLVATGASAFGLAWAAELGVVHPAQASALYAQALRDSDPARAEVMLDAARADDPTQPVMAVARGDLALSIGGTAAASDAADAFADAARLGELGDEHLLALARLDAQLGRHQDAEAAARAAVAVEPFDPRALTELAALATGGS